MKYTRYDMKRKNKNNLVVGIVLLSTVIFAFIIGTLIFNVFFKNQVMNESVLKPNSGTVEVVNKEDNKEVNSITSKYIAVQHGLFSKPEYVERATGRISSYGNPFTVQDLKGTRVLLGIYTEEEASKVVKTLSDNGIENSKLPFDINSQGNPCDESITAIISAELDILTNLSDSNTKSITITSFKKWTSELKEVDKKSKNISILNELKTQVNELPEELGKEKVSECYTFIFNTLNKLSVK